MAAGTVTTLGCLQRSAGRSRPSRSLVPFMRSSSGMNKLFQLFAMYAVFLVINCALSIFSVNLSLVVGLLSLNHTAIQKLGIFILHSLFN